MYLNNTFFNKRSYHRVDTKTVLRGLRHAQISFEYCIIT